MEKAECKRCIRTEPRPKVGPPPAGHSAWKREYEAQQNGYCSEACESSAEWDQRLWQAETQISQLEGACSFLNGVRSHTSGDIQLRLQTMCSEVQSIAALIQSRTIN